ncbi:MAG: hypothetical protein QW728_01015, partial [Thermoplasmata archaeon]
MYIKAKKAGIGIMGMLIILSTIGFFMPVEKAKAQEFVVINEIFYDMPGTDYVEFIELYGTPGMSLNGYYINFTNGANGQQYDSISLSGYSIGPSGFFLIATNSTAYPDADIIDTPSSNWLQNGPGDMVYLNNSGGIVDLVAYAGNDTHTVAEGWPTISVSAGYSIGRLPDGRDTNNNSEDFFNMTPTPKASNGAPPAPTGPTISNITYTPAVPFDTDSVVVNATVTGEAITSVLLNYSVNGTYMPVITMSDSGSGVYTATIPPQPAGSTVVFFISATNASGTTNSSSRTYQVAAGVVPIATAREMMNQTVTVEGVVTCPPGVLSTNYFFIQDSTAGIQAYKQGGFTITINLGDTVRVMGTVSEYQNLTEIVVTSVTVLSSGMPPYPAPEPRNVFAGIGETEESELLQLVRATVVTVEGSYVNVTDETNNPFVVFISNTTIRAMLPVGTIANITGIIVQYNTIYELKPRYIEDIQVISTAEVAPYISTPYITPSSPSYDQDVTVYANVSDINGNLHTVLLNYSVDNGTWTSVPMTGTGLFSAVIPATNAQSYVQYKIWANDSTGLFTESSIFTYVTTGPVQIVAINTLLSNPGTWNGSIVKVEGIVVVSHPALTNNVFIQNGTDGLVVYLANTGSRTLTFEQGQKVIFQGRFVNDSTYGPELMVYDASNATNVSSGHQVNAETLSIAQALEFTEIGSYVKVCGVVEGFSGGTSFRIVSGGSNITIYDSATALNFSQISFLADGVMVCVEGVVAFHSSVGNEIKPWNNSQITQVQGANMPPAITNISQTPAAGSVYSTDAVIVSAYVSDNEGDTLTVTLIYRNGTANNVSVQMSGGNGQNGTYTATIPAFPAGSQITYYISASDGQNTTNSSTRTYTVSTQSTQYTFIIVNAAIVETGSIMAGSVFHINVTAKLDGAVDAVGGTITTTSSTSWLNGLSGAISQNGYHVLAITAQADGTFSMTISVSSQGLSNTTSLTITVEPSAQQHTAISITLQANATSVAEGTAVTLFGTVLYEDQSPVPEGTVVTIGTISVQTAANGSFSVEITPSQTTTYLAEATVGTLYDNASITITVVPAQQQHSSITVTLNGSIPTTLEPGQIVYITGVAKYEDNSPAAGIQVKVEVNDINKTGTTDTAGAFNISITMPQTE